MPPEPGLQDAIDRFYRGLLAGDAAALEALLSRREDLLFIGTAPEEWWADHDTIARVIRAQAELFGGGLEAEGSAPRVAQDGAVGWLADRFTLRLPDGTAVPMRVTAVLLREGGEWRLVQIHSSVGVPNTEAFRREFTL